MTSGGKRKPANADLGGSDGRGRVDNVTGQACHGLANDQRNGPGQPLTTAFRAAFADADITAVKNPPRSPRANAYAERIVLTARAEVTNRMHIFGAPTLAARADRVPRALQPTAPPPDTQSPPRSNRPAVNPNHRRTMRRPILGRLINEYDRAA